MSSAYVSADLRRLVVERALSLCEYCLIHEDDTHFGCQIDHIISEKHGGETDSENLANACSYCNRYKGSDVGSFDAESGEFVRFFNPRLDRWADQFELGGITIVPVTAIGRVTVSILQMNHIDRLIERSELAEIGRHPTLAAYSVADKHGI